MQIGLYKRCASAEYDHYSLVDILRVLATADHRSVVEACWYISEMEIHMHGSSMGQHQSVEILFSRSAIRIGHGWAVVTGRELLSGTALVHQFESFYCARLIDPSVDPVMLNTLRMSGGPSTFQASNVNIEIRCEECCPVEVVTTDDFVIESLKAAFGDHEIIE